MKRGLWGVDPELLVDNSKHGVIRAERLVELGVPRYTAYRRCRPDGPWQRLLPGVLSLYKTTPSREQMLAAAELYAGSAAVVTGSEACRAHRLRSIPGSGPVHVLTPHGCKVQSSGFVLIERTRRMPRPIKRAGMPVAPAARAVLDTVRRMSDLRSARALLSECVQRGFASVSALSCELEAGSSRGSAIPRRIIAELMAGTESVAEIDAEQLWQRSELPAPLWNHRLLDRNGVIIAKPDAWFDEVGLAWEIDSFAYHLDPEGYARTLARNGRYAAAGVLVLQTLPARLRTDTDAVIAELRAAYRAAAARPRPNVRVLA
ncbi:hypothetical protein ACFWY9_31665 [Amycolatopsis sp. NPDC059027]|uniref:hypothetical protein n=1 Tax=unclassified Amycolatopsis TaxID=2618356 RepID=UPI0036706A4F